jgi:hypothetical protein
MARLLPCLLPLTVAGCVIPITASPDETAGPSRDAGDGFPSIVEATPPMPGPQTFLIGQKGLASVTLADSDIDQTLYVRVFRDYNVNVAVGPVSTQSVPNDPVHGKEERAPLNLDTSLWCSDASNGELRTIDVVVADQEFDPSPSAQPYYRVVTNGGKLAIRSWVVKCQTP